MRFLLLAVLCFASTILSAHPNPKINNFITDLALNSSYTLSELEKLFENFTPNQKIIDLMEKPFEQKSWDDYYKYLVTEQRIKLGVEFWRNNATILQEAQSKYGVPAEIIVAIMGIETFYGQRTGEISVLEALGTFAFFYPKRETFFTKELKEFLLMCKEENLPPNKPRGSYAGAMGKIQFMPSSFRHYAVDFSHKGKKDIFNRNDDSIASIANYLKLNGWHKDESNFLIKTNKDDPIRDAKMSLIEFDTQNSADKYWLGLHNFYVIKRYNVSKNYARAVVDLSAEIKKQMQESHG